MSKISRRLRPAGGRLAVVFLAAVSLASGKAQAGVIWNFTEDLSGVTGTFSGSLDLTGATKLPGGNNALVIFASQGVVSSSGAANQMDRYEITGPASFGSGGFIFASSASGDPFSIFRVYDFLGVVPGYVSGGALSGSVVFSGHSFSSLGVTPGTYVYSLPNDTVTLNFGPVSQVPEPSTLLSVLTGLAVMSAVMSRRVR